MRPSYLFRFAGAALLAGALAFAPVSHAAELRVAGEQFASAQPEITAIKGRTVRVRVPAGFDRVTLQALTSSRKGHRVTATTATPPAWKTVGIQYSRGAALIAEFRLVRLTPRRHLRVFGEQAGAVSGDLLTGISSFLAEPPEIAGQPRGGQNLTFQSNEVTAGFRTDGMIALAGAGAGIAPAEVRTVAEADIWKLNGDRLYYFNDRRGLQVFDVQNPDEPALLGTLRMPAMGEDMYLLDDAHVVLLKKAWDWYWWDWDWEAGGRRFVMDSPVFLQTQTFSPGTSSGALTLDTTSASIAASQLTIAPQRESNRKREIVIANVEQGAPRVVGSVEFEGTVRESRLVGKVLYLAADVYRAATASEPARWGLEVSSFDLHDPSLPVRRATVHLGGWANAVTATDTHFFVSKNGVGQNTVVEVLDISDPNGAMARAGSVTVPGQVADKFKMRETGGILTVVSQKWRPRTPEEIEILRARLPNPRRGIFWAPQVGSTAVHTFALANLASPVPLGSLELAQDETLYATRFDGNRLYIVTALVEVNLIWDPLWIVDLTNPALPTVLGELEMPGFSTYIEPLGDRLVTIGLLDRRPTVSLFDVSDAAKPTQLSRIQLTSSDGFFASEAVWNEKAFSVLPEENLVLLPLSGRVDGDFTRGVQLLDLGRDRLVKRGFVSQPLAPRRATVHRDRIIAVSPGRLLTIDATDRDKPVVTADVEIAWDVSRVFAIGEHLVQLGLNATSPVQWKPTLTVTPANAPDETLDMLQLTSGGPVSDATVRDGVLYIAQVQGFDDAAFDPARSAVARERAIVSAIDVSRLPKLHLLSSTTANLPGEAQNWWWRSVGKFLWLNEATLAFVMPGAGQAWFVPKWYDPAPYDRSYEDTAPGGGPITPRIVDPPGYWHAESVSRSTQRILALDVTDSARLKAASVVEIGAELPWDVAEPVATDGAIYASYRHLGRVRTREAFSEGLLADPDAFQDKRTISKNNRHFLQIVDYSNPAAPKLAPEHANLPGRLVSLARRGTILLTVGQHHKKTPADPAAPVAALHASVLHGSVAYLRDELPLTSQWQPLRFRRDTVFQFDPQPAKLWVPWFSEKLPISDAAPLATIGAIRITDAYWNGRYIANEKQSTLASWHVQADGTFAKQGELTLGHATAFNIYGDLGVVFERANQPHFLDVADPAAMQSLGFHNFEGAPYLNYEHADGSRARGLWIPTGTYGVEAVVFAP